jgi:hypothetical protein
VKIIIRPSINIVHSEFDLKRSWLFVTKINKVNTCYECSSKMFNFLNSSLHESLLLEFVMIIIYFFCSVA